MKISLQQDLHPDLDFYYEAQFRIYKAPYLIWDRAMWAEVLAGCAVWRIKVNGNYAGEIILDEKDRGRKDIVDFSILPEYQGKGVGRAVLEKIKTTARKISAVTRNETLGFFLKCGFLTAVRIRDYYDPGVDGYYIVWDGSPQPEFD
jgi:GNAT superfamily N-acetyltransferase